MKEQYKDDLYDLVHGLSKSEKRHFKLTTSYDDNSRYLQLFDLLNELKVYNKAAIHKKTAEQGWTEEQVVAMRHYLDQLILKSLRKQYEAKNSEAQIIAFLQNAQIFRLRQQYRRSRQQLQKAKGLARYFDKPILEWQVLEAEQMLIDVAFQSNDQDHLQALLSNDQERSYCMQRIQNQQAYRQLLLQVRSIGQGIFQKIATAAISPVEQLHQLLAHPLLQSIDTALTLSARYHFYAVRIQCYFYLHRYDLYAQDNQAIAAIWDGMDKALLVEYQDMYQGALYNEMLYYIHINDGMALRKRFDRLQQLLADEDFEPIHADIFVKRMGLELHFLGANGQIAEALTLVQTKGTLFKMYAPKCAMRDSVATAFVIGRTYFYAHQFVQAYDWFQWFLQEYHHSSRMDLLLVGRTLHVMAEYEQHRSALVEHLSRSAQRFFKQKTNLYQTPLLVLQYIQKLAATYSPLSHPPLYRELQTKIAELLQQNEKEHNVLQLFDFRLWIESHLLGKQMMQNE